MSMVHQIAETKAYAEALKEGETREDRIRAIARSLLFAAGMEMS